MQKGRLEAFSDGVIAIILTIMVLELKAPHGSELADLLPLLPIFLGYVLSFIYVGIYWNNHHHLFQAVHHVNGRVLWANLHLLFWMSLVPFSTAWLGESGFHSVPVALYGLNLLFTAIAYTILIRALVSMHDRDSALVRAIGSDKKGKVSLALYTVGTGLSFVAPQIAYALFVLVALIWLVPDQRIEKQMQSS
jgi:uncharacterized membrane protein